MTGETNPVGRPPAIDLATLAKLEEAFSIGATDREACLVANISVSALYHFQDKNPEYIQRKEKLKDMVKYQARYNVAEAVKKGDKNISQWYLERKVKDEFAQRTEQTGVGGKDLIPQPSDRIKELASKLNDEHRPKLPGSGDNPSDGTITDTVGITE